MTTNSTEAAEWMLLPEVAHEYGIPEQTLYYWRHQGRGPKSYKAGRRIRYRRSEIDAWLESQANEAT